MNFLMKFYGDYHYDHIHKISFKKKCEREMIIQNFNGRKHITIHTHQFFTMPTSRLIFIMKSCEDELLIMKITPTNFIKILIHLPLPLQNHPLQSGAVYMLCVCKDIHVHVICNLRYKVNVLKSLILSRRTVCFKDGIQYTCSCSGSRYQISM